MRKRIGSPTPTLRSEILLALVLSFIPSLKVSLGKCKLPYTVPNQNTVNNWLNQMKMKLNGNIDEYIMS